MDIYYFHSGKLLSSDEIEGLMRGTDDPSKEQALVELREALMFDRQEDIAERKT